MSSTRTSDTRLVIARRRVPTTTSLPASSSAATVCDGTTPMPMPCRIAAITAWTLSTTSARSRRGGKRPKGWRNQLRIAGAAGWYSTKLAAPMRTSARLPASTRAS